MFRSQLVHVVLAALSCALFSFAFAACAAGEGGDTGDDAPTEGDDATGHDDDDSDGYSGGFGDDADETPPGLGDGDDDDIGAVTDDDEGTTNPSTGDNVAAACGAAAVCDASAAMDFPAELELIGGMSGPGDVATSCDDGNSVETRYFESLEMSVLGDCLFLTDGDGVVLAAVLRDDLSFELCSDVTYGDGSGTSHVTGAGQIDMTSHTATLQYERAYEADGAACTETRSVTATMQ